MNDNLGSEGAATPKEENNVSSESIFMNKVED